MSVNGIPSSNNPYIDEISPGNVVNSALLTKASHHAPSAVEEAAAAGSNQETVNQFIEPADFAEELGEREDFEFERDFNGVDELQDEFIRKEDDRDQQEGQGRQRRRRHEQRKIGKAKRKAPLGAGNFSQADVEDFAGFLGETIQVHSNNIDAVDTEFENWNDWFKTEKIKPPQPDSTKVFFKRDLYTVNRSPHLWKSNPDNSQWVLAFGHSRQNNIVSANLYKYQNETLEIAA